MVRGTHFFEDRQDGLEVPAGGRVVAHCLQQQPQVVQGDRRERVALAQFQLADGQGVLLYSLSQIRHTRRMVCPLVGLAISQVGQSRKF